MEFLVRIPPALVWAYGAAVAVTAGVILRRRFSTWRVYRDARRLSEEPRCGRCGYIVRPGASVVCSECGSDVREGGIVGPRTLPPGRPLAWYVLVVLLALPVALWLGPRVAPWQPFGWDYETRWLQRIDAARGGRGQFTHSFHAFRVYAKGSGRFWGRRPALVVPSDGWDSGIREEATFRKLIRASDVTFEEMDPVARRLRRRPFERGLIGEWVARAAPDASVATRDEVVLEMEAAVVAALRGELPPTAAKRRSYSSVTYRLRDRVPLAVSGVCYVLLACGAAWGIRRLSARRRRLARESWQRAAEGLGLVAPGAR